MAKKLIPITGRQLYKRILAGERDFKGVRLVGLKDFRMVIPELNQALRKWNKEKENLEFEDANLEGIVAPNIYLNNAWLNRANLSNAYLMGAYLSARLYGTDFSRTDMRGADLTNSGLDEADFKGADIRGVIGLETVNDLGYATFGETIVTKKEKRIIENIMRIAFFDVRKR